MTHEELQPTLDAHREWLTSGGARGKRADLTGADLYGANLTRADLTRADLTGADLTGADLYGADLTGANLTRADLTGAKNIPNMARLRTQIVPDDGPFRGYKKLADGYVAILDVPESAQRSNATGRKCRVSEAVVRRLYHPDHPEADVQEGRSRHDAAFIYRVGETVRPTELFDENRWNECGSGIHLFITRAEAEAY